jgi:hypothetical protein
MSSRWDKSPNKAEIADQLRRMLENDIFVSRPQHAKLLNFLIMSALAEKTVTQKDIRAACFPSPPYESDSAIARTTVNYLKKLLPDYYAQNSTDLVIITLPGPSKDHVAMGNKLRFPAGEAYRPVFHYNPDHADIYHYRLALHCIGTKNPMQVQLGAAMLLEVISKRKELPSAYVALAEAECLIATCARSMDESFFSRNENIAERGYQLNGGDWHAACAYALGCLFNHFPAFSSAALVAATDADPDRTRNHIAFQIHMFLSGKIEQALTLMRVTADDHFDDAYLYALEGLFRYMTREFDAARLCATNALAFDLNCWLAYLLHALLDLCSDEAPNAYESLMQVHRSCGYASSEDFLFPGVLAVAAAVAKNMTQDEREAVIDKVMHYELMTFTQQALCLMVTNKRTEAIEALEFACGRREPATLFLPFLPIFDPLRNEEGFQAILDLLPTVPPLFGKERAEK